MAHRRLERLAAALVAGGLAVAAQAPLAQPQMFEDIVVSDPDGTMTDPEFDKTLRSLRMSWQDDAGKLWVTDIDPMTGIWAPRDGRQVLIDTELLPIFVTRQGVEWAYDDGFNRIVYTKLDPVSGDISLHQAAIDAKTGRYVATPLEEGAGQAIAKASQTEGDPFPRAIYTIRDATTGEVRFGWRFLDGPNVGALLPDGFKNATWVADKFGIVGRIRDAGVEQVAYYNLDRAELRQLTFEPGEKRWPLLMRDLAREDDLLVATIRDEEFGIWRRGADGVWTLEERLAPPSVYPFLFKPDFFYWEGGTYVAYLASSEKDGRRLNAIGESEVWITRIAGEGPGPRHVLVSDPVYVRLKDVENVVTDDNVFIYYAEKRDDGRTLIHRVKLFDG